MMKNCPPGYDALTGQTPLVPLPRLSERTGRQIFAKCEFLNPTGSIKDRTALEMIRAAERNGRIVPGKSIIVEATGGNTGLALAALAAFRRYGLIVTMSSKMSKAKVDALTALGATVVICPYEVPPDSPENFLAVARRLADEHPDRFFIDQFSNKANIQAHRLTAAEIWRDRTTVDAVIAGAGTGGTIMGIAQYVREQQHHCSVVLADPVGSVLASAVRGEQQSPRPYRVEGIGGDSIPPLFDPALVDHAVSVPDDASFAECQWLRENEGLWLGGSSGCVVAAAVEFAQVAPARVKTIVLLFADSGRNYIE
jgi:cystathionine beta-synthase